MIKFTLATLGRSITLPCGSPSPPLLHEVKLSGPVAGGPGFVRLRQEGKLALQSRGKTAQAKFAAGGQDIVGSARRVSWSSCTRLNCGGGVELRKSSSSQEVVQNLFRAKKSFRSIKQECVPPHHLDPPSKSCSLLSKLDLPGRIVSLSDLPGKQCCPPPHPIKVLVKLWHDMSTLPSTLGGKKFHVENPGSLRDFSQNTPPPPPPREKKH